MSLKFIHQDVHFYFLDFNYLRQFFQFNDVSINKIIAAVFDSELFQIGCLKTVLSYCIYIFIIVINIALVFLPI